MLKVLLRLAAFSAGDISYRISYSRPWQSTLQDLLLLEPIELDYSTPHRPLCYSVSVDKFGINPVTKTVFGGRLGDDCTTVQCTIARNREQRHFRSFAAELRKLEEVLQSTGWQKISPPITRPQLLLTLRTMVMPQAPSGQLEFPFPAAAE